jgi:hypothetical protein
VKRSARVLSFSPRPKSLAKRAQQPARVLSIELAQLEATCRAELQATAQALGLAAQALEANQELYDHARVVLDIEAAYRKSASRGRAALVEAVKQYFDDGYTMGADDAQMSKRRAAR